MASTSSFFFPLTVLVLAQLSGEACTHLLDVPLPGSVVGAVLLFALFCAWPRLHARVGPLCDTLVRNMLLFYVPASVGIVQILPLVRQNAPLLAAVVVITTPLTALISAVCLERLQRAP